MITPLILFPSIFDFKKEIDTNFVQKYSSLLNLLKQISKHSFVIQDSKGFIATEIREKINNITQQDLRKQLQFLYQTILVNYTKKIKVDNIFEGDLIQTCGILISLLNLDGNYNGIYYNSKCDAIECGSCISKNCKWDNYINLDDLEKTQFLKELIKLNYIFDESYSIENFKNKFLKYFIENTSKIIIYDEQISNLNKNTSDIAENFKFNLEYWIDYFYMINSNITLNFYTTIKDRGNSIQTKRILSEFTEKIRRKYNKPDFNIKIVNKKLHERYFYSDKLIFSCDKGIDLINIQSQRLTNHLHISILDCDAADKISKIIKNL